MDAYPAHTLRVFVGILIILAIADCRFVSRPDVSFSPSLPWRCGIYRSHIYVRDIQEVIYPDLGLVVANSAGLGLTSSEVTSTRKLARECFEICELEKQHIRLKEEQLKEKLALNEIQGDLTKVAKEVNEIRVMEKLWLKGHSHRYHKGIKPLNIFRAKRIALLFSELKPFPQINLSPEENISEK